ncbi:phage tail sheath family protein [Saccharothrix syringae]|uniref:Phage tail sheath family protein n=1 Tax=Saccharothrix syringae TaxID=103733 RepID=A0A5Q0GXE2_SACSY|nr:phage tail sheath C-terminal domain-containing protein [Saccharothrix syringae]QFZ18649.1 phage tail sheath family protein [Saccharothrix syringae]
MPEYLSPGTYVEELPADVVPIEGVGTSTAGFAGLTERGPTAATLVTSWPEFERWYGGVFDPERYLLPISVQGFFANGGLRAYIARVTFSVDVAELRFGEGGPRVRAVGPGDWGKRIAVRVQRATLNPNAFRLQVLYFTVKPGEPIDEAKAAGATVIEDFDELVTDPTKSQFAPSLVNTGSQIITLDWPKTPTAALEPFDDFRFLGISGEPENWPTADHFIGKADANKGATGLAALAAVDDIALLAVPDAVNPAMQAIRGKVVGAMIEQCEKLKNRFAILDVERGKRGFDGKAAKPYLFPRSDYAAIYYPHVRTLNPMTGQPVLVPPSGFVAGLYAFNDTTRGVHKAPANYELRGILTEDVRPGEGPLEFTVSKGQHDTLNPVGVNVIRDFRAAGRGVRVWGARTTWAHQEWMYVNVRRLFNFVEESVNRGSQWVVFEPNSEPTWARLRRTVDAFLEQVWRDGALMGDSKEQAYFIRCDRSTMSQADILGGRLYCLIGLAPVRPAEFVILRFSQKTIEAAG